jgi:hypothetical protein
MVKVKGKSKMTSHGIRGLKTKVHNTKCEYTFTMNI